MEVGEVGRRELQEMIAGKTYAAPVSFNGVQPGDFRAIVTMPCLLHAAVRDILEDVGDKLALYTWAGHFFWGVDKAAVM